MSSPRDTAGAAADTAIGAAAEDVYVLPASFGQERFVALDEQVPGNPTWNLPVRFRLQGTLDPALLERAFNTIVERHEVLRTTLRVVDGQLAQVIAGALKIVVPVTDLRQLAQPARDAEVDRLSLAEARRRFDLTTGPLLRVGLLRVADGEHVLLVTPHHSMADYWSIGLISDELGALYDAYSRGLPSPLPEPVVQYGDYAIWQREQAESAPVRSELAYWKERLSGLPLLEFPTDAPRGGFPTYDAAITSQLLPVGLTDSLRMIGNQHGATFFNTLLAALQIVLHQYTGQHDFGVSTQVAGRDRVEIEKLVGLFINTVVMRADLAGNPSFPALLERVSETGAQTITHQGLRFEQLLKELRPADYPSHHTLFRVNFICQRDPVKPLEFAGIKLTVIPSKSQGALYDLNVFLVLRDEGWRLACEYNTDLFTPESITRLLTNYRRLLEAIAENPERRIAEFPRGDLPAGAAPDGLASASPSPTTTILEAPSAEPGPAAVRRETMTVGADGEDAYAFDLTLEQQPFWLLDQLLPGNPALNMQMALRLQGPFDLAILERSLNELIRRHEILRTTFRTIAGRAMQLVHASLVVTVPVVDMPAGGQADREWMTQQMLRGEALRPFNLLSGPLVRAAVLRLAPDQHLLTITMPHIVCDGWSNGILMRELTALYAAYSTGQPSPLPELSIQYADFACWQNEWLKTADLREDLAYWRNQLHGRLPLLELPGDHPAPAGMVAKGDTETLTLPPAFVATVKEFCKREEITMFMLFLAVFKAMLYRYTGRDDILVGSPVAGRTPDTEGVVGPFAYPISLRTNLGGDPDFRELLHRVRDVVLGALEHKDLPFGRLIEEINAEQIQGRNSPFQFYFLHQVAFLQPTRTGNLEWVPITWISPGTVFDLHLATLERPDGLVARLEYKSEAFDAASIRRMLGHFRALVEGVVANPELKIAELPLAAAGEPPRGSSQPIAEAGYGDHETVVDLFDRQAAQRPKAVAAWSVDGTLKYDDLQRRATELAGRLRAAETGPDPVVGICCDLSGDFMVSALAVMKAGAAYVWLRPEMLEDGRLPPNLASHVRLVIADKTREAAVRRHGMEVLPFGNERSGAAADATGSLTRIDPQSLGAIRLKWDGDGDCKLVPVTHRALLARAAAAAHVLALTGADRLALLSSSVAEEILFASLIVGATVALKPPAATDAEILQLVEKQRCSVVVLPTRRMQRLLFRHDSKGQPFFRGVRQVVVYGERPAAAAVIEFAGLTGGAMGWASVYGTPESGAIVAAHQPLLDAGSLARLSVALGGAAPGFAIALRDRRWQEVPGGIPGEICVAGAGLAQGYLDDPTATAERFVTSTAGRFFRTGALGRYRPDGGIEYLGDPGQNLKQRGFVFHLGEIEAALARHHAVEDVAVVSERLPSGEERPAIYAVLRADAAVATTPESVADRRSQFSALAIQEAPYCPKIRAITFVDHIDRREDGRVTPGTLPAYAPGDYEAGVLVAPRDEIESRLVGIWQELLGAGSIGITQNFFELGGNSITAARLFAQVDSLWSKKVPLSILFEAPTIEHLAQLLRDRSWTPASLSLVPIRPTGTRPPLFIISGIGGNVVRFHDLTRLLDEQQPVYALQPPGLDGEAPCLTRIEDMAAHYIKEIRSLQPAGPYYLAGYSFGGLVTFEIAQQLAVQGERVALLAMLEAPEWRYQCDRAKRLKAYAKLDRYRNITANLLFRAGRREYLWERLRRRGSNLIYALFAKFGRSLPQSIGTIQDINVFAAGCYLPRSYAGRLTVFRTRPEVRTPIDDDTQGWAPLVLGGIEVYEVPGEHNDITSQPNVRILAQKLGLSLEKAQRGAAQPGVVILSNSRPVNGDPDQSEFGEHVSALVRAATVKG
jgi:non-ribosomal peptide synthetase component F/thioesterase domain-containing protein